MTTIEATRRRLATNLKAAAKATEDAARAQLAIAQALVDGDRKAAEAALKDNASHLVWARSRTVAAIGDLRNIELLTKGA